MTRTVCTTGNWGWCDMAITVGNVTITLDTAHLAARMKNGKERCGQALAEQILGDCRTFTPHAEGDLEASGRAEQIDGDWAATWNTVYAAYQYYGCWPDGSHVIRHHNTDVNANATTQWCEAAKAVYGESWGVVAQKEHVAGSEEGT